MNTYLNTSRSLAATVQILVWAWLIGLTIALVLGYRTTTELAGQPQLESAQRQLQLLESRVAELTKISQDLLVQPKAATAAALQEVQDGLAGRIAELDQTVSARATASDLETLRSEVEQIRNDLSTQRRPTQTAHREDKPSRPSLKLKPLPFRIVGAELRAGERTVSVAPLSKEVSAAQIKVLLPGEAVEGWRLDAIDGNVAVFRAGTQIRRLTIP